MEQSLETIRHTREAFHGLVQTVQEVTNEIVEVSTATEGISAETKNYTVQMNDSLKEQELVLKQMSSSTYSLRDVTSHLDELVNNVKA